MRALGLPGVAPHPPAARLELAHDHLAHKRAEDDDPEGDLEVGGPVIGVDEAALDALDVVEGDHQAQVRYHLLRKGRLSLD